MIMNEMEDWLKKIGEEGKRERPVLKDMFDDDFEVVGKDREYYVLSDPYGVIRHYDAREDIILELFTENGKS